MHALERFEGAYGSIFPTHSPTKTPQKCVGLWPFSSVSRGFGGAILLTSGVRVAVTLRVQVPNHHILTQNQHYNYYYSKPKYLTIR